MTKLPMKTVLGAFATILLASSSLGMTVTDASAKTKFKKSAAASSKKPKPEAPKPAVATSNLPPVTLDEPRGPYIEEAPTDDYRRVSWCHGALTGHMELAEMIKDVSPYDPQIHSIGMSYLRAYEAALTLSQKGETTTGRETAEKARLQGYDSWSMARQAKVENAAWAYDTWQLPGDCEKAAISLSGHDQLFAEMATEDEMKIIEATITSSQQKVTELPAPKIKAQNAPEDPDAPVSTKRVLAPVKNP